MKGLVRGRGGRRIFHFQASARNLCPSPSGTQVALQLCGENWTQSHGHENCILAWASSPTHNSSSSEAQAQEHFPENSLFCEL